MRASVVVSGVPGSGKTTLAADLSTELKLPHIDKDAILEGLFSTEPVRTEQERKHLSRRADFEFQLQALKHQQVILSSWWWHPAAEDESGTPVGWVGDHAASVIEIFCWCPVETAAKRFFSRVRHSSHLDRLRSPAVVQEQLRRAAARGPMFPGAIVCDTSAVLSATQLVELASSVRLLLSKSEA